jgi:hypothetical protein
MHKIFILVFCISSFTAFSQINVDSVFIYYGMTQSAPEAPLMDYIQNLEKNGARIQKLKKDELEKFQTSFSKTKPRKYKGEKHKGTVYFLVLFSNGNKQYAAIDSSLDSGKLINLSTKQVWTLEDKAAIDKLYYDLLQIH